MGAAPRRACSSPATSSPRRAPRSRATCCSASRAPTSASAPRSSPRPPACSPLYNTDAARRAAANPNFDPRAVRRLDRHDLHHRAGAPPGALRAARRRPARADPPRHLPPQRHQTRPPAPVFFCLDEVANIAPIHDLPALVSEAGGQGLHVMACLQDLSQARARWGDGAAEGFLTLFQTKLVLPGISDPRTLEALSLVLGEIDRPMPTHSTGYKHLHHRLVLTDHEDTQPKRRLHRRAPTPPAARRDRRDQPRQRAARHRRPPPAAAAHALPHNRAVAHHHTRRARMTQRARYRYRDALTWIDGRTT